MKPVGLLKSLKACPYHLSPTLCRLGSTAVLRHEERQPESVTTVDKTDVEFYGKFASRWWDENGDMKGLHAMNRLRVQLIRDGLKNSGQVDFKIHDSPQPLQGIHILEIGCGGGILCEPLARIGANVTGIDANQNLIETAKSHASQDSSISNRITYYFGTIEEHVNENRDHYDAVVASEVLEHVNHKDLFLEAAVSTLKPGGSIFITTLNKTLAMWAGGIMLAEYILRLVPQGTHDINKCVRPHELQAMLEKNGCSLKLIHGMMYNFLANEWFWSNNTSMNYAVHAVRRK